MHEMEKYKSENCCKVKTLMMSSLQMIAATFMISESFTSTKLLGYRFFLNFLRTCSVEKKEHAERHWVVNESSPMH